MVNLASAKPPKRQMKTSALLTVAGRHTVLHATMMPEAQG
jgi:hypothetical protein